MKPRNRHNQAIEFHDSTLEAICWVGVDALLKMNVFVHSSVGRPGWDEGVGWYQDAEATVLRADLKHCPEGNVLEVYDGSVHMGDEGLLNLLPLPCAVDVPVELVLSGLVPSGNPDSLLINGAGLRVVFTGEAGEVEQFRP